MSKAGIAPHIIEEVNLRTPGYISWQQEHWLSHCNDACEFHGDAASADVRAAAEETKQAWLAEYKQDEKGWKWATEGYQPGGDSALHKFVCTHCHVVLLGWDLSKYPPAKLGALAIAGPSKGPIRDRKSKAAYFQRCPILMFTQQELLRDGLRFQIHN